MNQNYENVKKEADTETLKCCICGTDIDKHYDENGRMFWDKGHNAQPIYDGRCCSFCNAKIVIRVRILLDKLTEEDDKFKVDTKKELDIYLNIVNNLAEISGDLIKRFDINEYKEYMEHQYHDDIKRIEARFENEEPFDIDIDFINRIGQGRYVPVPYCLTTSEPVTELIKYFYMLRKTKEYLLHRYPVIKELDDEFDFVGVFKKLREQNPAIEQIADDFYGRYGDSQ